MSRQRRSGTTTARLGVVVGSLVLATACAGDDGSPAVTETEADTGGQTTSVATGMATTSSVDETAAGTSDGSDTRGQSTDDTVGDTADATGPATGSTSTGTGGSPFIFVDADPSEYVQSDRQGFPAVNTGLNLIGDKDAYNTSNPADDVGGSLAVNNAVDSLLHLHLGPAGMKGPGTGVADDLTDLGFTLCGLDIVGTTCVDQAVRFSRPDTINLVFDADVASTFPDGREPADAVMDIVLAVMLLDLEPPIGSGDEPITRLYDLNGDMLPGDPLNPVANDVPFPDGWPHLAPAHE